jgi:hypothetical protein
MVSCRPVEAPLAAETQVLRLLIPGTEHFISSACGAGRMQEFLSQ